MQKSLRSMKNGTIDIPIVMWSYGKPSEYTMQVRARTGKKNLKAFRGLNRAATGFASDPMDEAGLKFGRHGEVLLDKHLNNLFEFKVIDSRERIRIESKDGKKVWFKNNPNYGKELPVKTSELEPWHKNQLIQPIKGVNQAIYSRNWAENRRFHMWEIQKVIFTNITKMYSKYF